MKKVKLAGSAAFVLALILPTLVWAALKFVNIFNPSFMDGLDYDLGENRYLARMPKMFGANFTAELEECYNDHMPFRSVIITADKNVTAWLEKPYKSSIRPALIAAFYTALGDAAGQAGIGNDMASGGNGTSEGTSSNGTPLDSVVTSDGGNTESGSEYAAKPQVCHNYEAIETVEPSYTQYGFTVYRCSLCGDTYTGEYRDKLIDTSYFPQTIYNDKVVEGRFDWLFYLQDIVSYTGGNLLSEEALKARLAAMKRLKELCDSQGKELIFLILPDKELVYSEYLPTYKITNEYRKIPRLVDYVTANSDIRIVYPLEELIAGKMYRETYFRSDTHWNNAGILIGMQALYEELGLPDVNPYELAYEKKARGPGDLATMGNLAADMYDSDYDYTVTGYRENVTVTDEHGDYTGIGSVFTQSDSENICNMVMLGDSFRIGMIPFMKKDFSGCAFAYKDYAYGAEMITAIRNADLIIMELVERFEYKLPDNLDVLIGILEGEE